MKRNIYLKIILLCFLLTGCRPGLYFEIKNCTNEKIEVNYVICDDLLYPSDVKTVLTTLECGEIMDIDFSLNNLFNRGVEGDDYSKTETFLSFFEEITIKYLESDILLNKDDLRQFNIQYTRELSAHTFTWLIENIEEGQ